MVRKLSLILFLFATSWTAMAQVSLSQKQYDFGELHRADQNWVDFDLVNNGDDVVHIFRIDAPKNVSVLFSNKEVQPHSTETIRISISPKSEGSFKIKLPLHTSAWTKPETITLLGTATYAANNIMPCPDFENPGGTPVDFHVSVKTESGDLYTEPLKILAFKSGDIFTEMKTDKTGEVSFPMPTGRYFLSIRSKDITVDSVMYVSHMANHLVVTFPDPPVEIFEETALVLPDSKKKVTPQSEEIVEPEVIVEKETEAIPDFVSKPIAVEESKDLPESKYKQNNLVFLVDISTSMKKNGKLDLLKVAMVDLLDVLRPTDRFTLISYASESNIIIQTAENLDKESCKKAIQDLTAGGDTEGAKALDAAGKAAIRNYVEAGNNQIFLATDGAFNQEIDKAIRIVNKYNRKDVIVSVIGIKCGPFTTKQMTELALEGNGRFLPINDSAQAGIELLNEVKRSALK
jgi:Ca-activated chloride channel family protein